MSSATAADVRDRLVGTLVRVEVAPDALAALPGQVLAHQLVSLTARLFDRIEVVGDDGCETHRDFRLLAGPFLSALRALVPTLRPVTPGPENGKVIRVLIGGRTAAQGAADIFVGAEGWVALLSTTVPQPVSEGGNPCGALAAGALAAGEVFKLAFDGRITGALRVSDVRLSLLTYAPNAAGSPSDQAALPDRVDIDAALFGCGSVGCAFLLGVLVMPALTGKLALVDNSTFETRNPYKYVLLDWAAAQRGEVKAEWAQDQVAVHASRSLSATPFVGTASQYVASLPEDYRIPVAVSAVDTVEARLEIQDTLPGSIVNAGISGTTVEVSSHEFGTGACLGCLAMRQDMESWSADPIATRTGLRAGRVRELIQSNGGLTREDVTQIIAAGKVPVQVILELNSHVGQPLLSFLNRMPYAEAAVATADAGARARVTTAFVSAFAGAVLFAEFLKASVPALSPYRVNNSYRQDLIGVPAGGLFRYERDPEGWCGCYSPFRLAAYRRKYGNLGEGDTTPTPIPPELAEDE